MRRRLLAQSMAVVGTIVLSSSAMSQDVRLGQYKGESREQYRTFYNLFVAGVKSGLMAYNVSVAREKGKAQALFCPPEELLLTTEQAEDIIDRTANEHQFPSDYFISLVLLKGLEETFPCTEPK